MAKNRLRYGKGRASIEIDGTLKTMLEKALREVAPMTMEIIEKELDERVEFAQKNWIVRGNRPAQRRDGSFYTIKQESKRSVDKFTQGIRIVDGGSAIEGFFRNNAQYAYAIKTATYSRTDDGAKTKLGEGKRVADETMWFPAEKAADKLAAKLADAYIKEQRKVK